MNPDKVPIVFNLVRAEGEEVGSYPVYSTPQDRQIGNLAANDQKQLELDNPNYDFEYRYANDLIVKRQGLMITVDDKVRYYGDRVNRFYDGSTDYTYHVFKVENGTAVEITAEEAGINTNSFTFTHLDTQTSSSGTYKDCISLSGVHSTIYDDNDITITAGNLTIIPRPVSVVAEDNTKVYGEADPELKYTLHDGVRGDDGNYYIEYANGPVLTEKEGADVPVQPGDLEGTGVTREPGEDVWTGEHSFGKAYAINANDISPVSKDGITNYIITMENGNFTITPAELVVTVKGGYSKTYGEENPAFDADITGFKRDDTQETVLNGELGFATLCYDLSDAGKYIVTAGNNNEDAVNPDCVVLEDGEEHIGSTFEVKTNTNFEKNYVIRYVNGDITVNPKELIVRIDHKVKTYGTADPAFTYRYEDNAGNVIGLIDPENSPLNLELYRTKGENVVRGDVTAADSLDKWGTTLFDGDYLISAKYDVNNKNYNVTVIDGSLKIVPATLTVKVNGGYRTTYGDEIPNFTYSITGFVGRDVKDETGTGIKDDESKVSGSATLYCNDTAGNPVSNKTKVGNYPINYDKQQLVADNSNYKFIYVGGDLTIGKKPIHVKADDQQKPYGEKDPDPLTWTITDPEELVNPGDEDFFDITTKRPGADTDDGEQVGKYPITIDGTDPSGNYEIITTPGTLTIVPATIVITVIDDEKYFGEDNPTPNVTITGFKRGDTIDDIGGKDALKTKTDAEKWSPVGEYPVSAKDSTFHNPNYDFVYIDGKLTVKPLIINIKAEDDRKTYGDNDPDKFEVSYTLTNEKDEEYQPSKDLRDYIDRALNLDGTRIPGENVRTENPGYPIIPSYTEVPNIEIGTVTPGRFFINPRVVTITANSAEKVYDGTPLTESGYTYAPELVDNEKLGIHDKMDSVTVIGSQTEVGSSPNVPSDAVIVNTMDGTSSNTNYTIKYVNGTLTVRDKEGVSIKKTADRERTTDYEVIRYTITVTNATSHDLHNVVVKDTNNFVGTPVLSQANGVTYDADNGEFIIDEISHLRDATHTNVVTFSYTYTVDPTDHGTDNNDILENNAKITDMKVVESYTENPDGTQTPNYTEPDKDWLVKTPDVDVEIIRQDLTIEKSADKTEAAVGDIVTYQLKVTNTGNSTLENVVVKDQNNFMGAPVENTQVHFGYRVNDDGTWTITSLGAGKTVTITYKYTVVAEDLANGKLDNIATATIPAREDPTIPEKPIDSNEVIVPLYYKHLTIVKSADRDHAYPGEVVKYQVTVTNDGTVDMTNVTVSDNTNALGMFIIASGDGYSYNPETKLFTIPVLNVGDVDKRDVIVVVDAGQKKVYGEADPELTWTATGDGSYYVSEDAGDLSGLKVVRPDAGTSAGEDVGMHPMIIEGTDDNFNITRVNNDFEITPATLHVTLAPQSKIYGDENPVLSGDDLIIDGFVTKPVKGNTTPDNTGVLSNANLTFNFTDAEGAPATVASHTGVGKVVPAGVENVAANNYIFVYSAADFTINKRPITVTAKPQTSIYGDAVAVEDWSDYGTVNILEYTGDTAKAALVNGDILEGTNLCLVTSASHVGGYDIVPSFSGLAHRVGQASYQDYLVTAMNGTYTVTQRPLTWTIGTVGSVYGNDMAELSNTLTYTGDADKKTIVNGDDLKAVISITKKDVENAKAEEISMKSADGAASLVAESVPESVKDYGAYDMVGSYDNDDYLITIVNGVYTIGERLVEVTVTEPKDIVYGDTTNPDFTVNAVATNGDGTHGAAVKPDSLGLKMALVYTPFENDKTTDNAQTAPLTADAKATLTPDIASGDDGVESDSQFKTENVKNAGTYTYTVSSDYDAAVEQNYAVTIKVVDADKNEADGQFVIARKDLTVTLDPNPSTKLYGTKTVIPEVKTSGYAFDESVETVKLPAFELIVASSVDGIFGNVGLTKDAFKYVGGSYDNYNYLPATGDLEVKRLKLDDVKEPITITGTVFDEKTGKNVEVTKNFGDDLSKLYFNSAVEVSAPEGYAIGTSDSLTDADWAKKMVISDNGTKVTSDFYLIDLTTGAITSVGTVTSSIDTVVPVTVSAFTANAVDAATKTDLMNEKFTKFETAINIFITGEEIGKAPVKEDDKKTDDTEKKDDADKKDETEKKDETTDESKKDETVDKSEAETQRVAHGKPTKDKTEKQSVVEVKASVPAISKLDGEYNSGVAKIQYYKVNGTNIVKDTEGNYTFDESKFETVDVKNISKDNGYVSFNLSPDWTGYIVTRTVDKAGNYGDVRVMSVKLENPPAPETPRATATPAPAEEKPAPKLIVAAQAPTGVGLSANIVIPVIVVVALIAVGAVVIVKKKGGKKEEAAEKTEDKPEEKSEDESKEDKQ